MNVIDKYIDQFVPIAKKLEQKYNIPFLVTLSQSALESNYGQNSPGNMYFGIKATNEWDGKTQELLTTEILSQDQFKKLKSYSTATKLESGKYKVKLKQTFRAYDNAYESFEDYAKLLTKKERFKNAFKYTDPDNFLKEIANAGYATAPDYYTRVRNIMIILKKKLMTKTMVSV